MNWNALMVVDVRWVAQRIASFVVVHESAAHSEAGKVGRDESVITEVASEVVA